MDNGWMSSGCPSAYQPTWRLAAVLSLLARFASLFGCASWWAVGENDQTLRRRRRKAKHKKFD
jgi:hypothetical protein